MNDISSFQDKDKQREGDKQTDRQTDQERQSERGRHVDIQTDRHNRIRLAYRDGQLKRHSTPV